MIDSKILKKAFIYVKDKLFLEKTNLIYDHVCNGCEKDFPTSLEIERGYPNPCGYSTGMEDGMINGATMLDALLIKIEKENDLDAICFAKKIVKGMLDTALASNEEGFIPRAVCVA